MTTLDAHVVVDRGSFRLDVSIAAIAGEVVAIMGPSGAGKSTLLAVLSGLVRPTDGRIRLGERTLDESGPRRTHVAPMQRGIVLLGQEPRLFPHLSARDNVGFALRTRGVGRARARAEASSWLDRVGLRDVDVRRPAELSGGQQQRVALARALAAEPHVLLLDEPLTSLDAATAADIRTVIAQQLAATATTAVLVTHDAIDAVALADRLVILEDGLVTQAGAVRTVLSEPATRFAAAIAGVNRLVGVAQHGAWTLGSVQLHPVEATSVALTTHDGRGLAAIVPPAAVELRRDDDLRSQPISDDADGWLARVVRLEATLGGVRVVTAPPDEQATVAAELPVATAAKLGLAPGVDVEVRVDRKHVRLLAL